MNTFVVCPICNKQYKKLNNAHLKSHGLTYWTFKEQYPNSPIETEDVKYRCINNRQSQKNIANTKKQNRIVEYNKNPSQCIHCLTPLSYEKRHLTFCNNSCAAIYNNTHYPKQLSDIARTKLKKLGKQSAITNFIINSHNSSSIDYKQCPICNNTFIINSKTKQRITCGNPNCISQIHSLNNHRQNKTWGKCGYFQGIWCASSWELAFVAFHLYHHNIIIRCPLIFTYNHESKTKRYFPDFIIDDIIYEIKGQLTEQVYIKTQAVKDAGYNIMIIDREKIIPIINQVKTLYNVKNITELYRANEGG